MKYSGFDFKYATKDSITDMMESLETKDEILQFLITALRIKERYIAKEQNMLKESGSLDSYYSHQGFLERLIEERSFIFDQVTYIRSEKDYVDEDEQYGFHQKNKQWVYNIFYELKKSKKSLSQNKRVEHIQDEYEKKFNASISKSEIYRLAEVYEYE